MHLVLCVSSKSILLIAFFLLNDKLVKTWPEVVLWPGKCPFLLLCLPELAVERYL